MENQLLDDTYFMRLTFKEAQKAYEKDEVPIGCIITCNNQIIARAHNLTQTLHDVTAHAEMQAITAASNFLNGKYLNECTLYVTLEPCVMCIGAISWAQIGKIVFAAPDTKRGFTLLNENRLLHPKTIVVSGVLQEECSNLIQAFFRQKRR